MMQNKVTCEKILIDYLSTHSGWHHKVDLFIVARDWSPETAGRTLRTLAESGKINVEYYDSTYAKHLAKYSIGEIISNKPAVKIEFRDGSPVAIMQ